MQCSEQELYINFTKSVVDSFENFVNSIDRNGAVLSDKDLTNKLRKIGKKLQTIFNKWENVKIKSCDEEDDTTKAIVDETPTTRKEELDEFEFEKIIAERIIDTSYVKEETVLSTEVSSTTVKLESVVMNDVAESTITLTKKQKECVRKFKGEGIKEEWIYGSEGFHVEEYSSGSWRCLPCKLDNLSVANIISHLRGKAHQKKIDLRKREVSETRKCEYDFNTDLSSTLTDVEPELLKKENGADIIIPFRGFYCNACSSTINSENSLKLHINGGKHRKNCESS